MLSFDTIAGIFSEARMQPGSVCRAWMESTGCRDAVDWDGARDRFPLGRAEVESARFRISDALEVEGVDPLGIFRKLLIHESTASMSRSWLRGVGFVHLEAASGIHLYCAWNAFASILRRIEVRGVLARQLIAGIRGILPPLLWLVIWSLSGFRPGLLRPLFLVAIRFIGERRGIRWVKGVPILIALGVDALLGFVFSFGEVRTFSDWAPGELHYAFSWWGGIGAAEFARARKWGTMQTHLALSLGSWLFVLPLDLFEGRFSPATPFLSFLTVEFLARGGYALFLATALSVGFRSEWGVSFLQWESALTNRAVGWMAAELSHLNLIRFI